MNTNDILILLLQELTALTTNPATISFASLDDKLGFVLGTTKKYLRDAAAKARFEVVEEGETLAIIRKLPPEPSRLVRG